MPGDGAGGGRRGGLAIPRLTWFKWTEVRIGRIRVITPKEGEEDRGLVTPSAHIKKALGFDEAAAKKDDRPTLVYFHWPHKHKTNGKLTTTVCKRVLDDEIAARWSKLFRCVQLDMGETESGFAERIGVEKGPSFVVLDEDLEIRARIPATKSGSKLRKALENAILKFPAYRKRIKRDMARQEQWLVQAKRLEKAGKYETALALVDRVRFGDLRVGPEFEKARTYGVLLAQKTERHSGGD